MAITTADRDLLITTMFEVVGEDYFKMAAVLRKLEVRFPAVTWRARAQALALTWPAYTASGLSINWWTTEVARIADTLP